jgi:hypothetical protein
MRPNFFIVGAPKCGTSALYIYLRTHPHIFLSDLKEPHYFAEDYDGHRDIRSLTDYQSLFDDATLVHKAVGEASVHYIHSSVAVQNIRRLNRDARLIAMLRNPIDLVHSYHAQNYYNRYDDVRDFQRAWRLQTQRKAGHHIPVGCLEPALLQYEHIGRLGSQVERLLDTFPKEQVKLILFDDFVRDPKAIYEEVLEFLELEQDGRSEFPVVNANRRPRIPFVQRFIVARYPPIVTKIRTRLLGKIGVRQYLLALNTVQERRSPMSSEFRRELAEVFANDVKRLSALLGRNVDHWITADSPRDPLASESFSPR